MIMTRPAQSNGAFVAELPQTLREALSIIESPLIRIRHLNVDPQLASEEQVIFTSSNAIAAISGGEGRQAYCVGERTTQAALNAGWQAEMIGRNVGELVSELKKIRPDGPLCHISGKHIRQDLVSALAPEGLTLRQVAVYDQELLPLTASAKRLIQGNSTVLVPLFSPRTAQHFATSIANNSHLCIIALSNAVADEWTLVQGSNPVVAMRPDAQSMIFEIEKIVHKLRLG